MKQIQSIPLSKFGGGVGASCHCGRCGLGGGCGLCRGFNCFGMCWNYENDFFDIEYNFP